MKYLQLIRLAIELAKIAEATIPGRKMGTTKAQVALEVAGRAFDVEEDLRMKWPDKAAFIGSIPAAVNDAVAILNAAGVFGPVAQTAAQ